MAKLKLTANPTFKTKVPVPVAGGGAVDVEMTFIYRRKTDLQAWIGSRSEKTDVESFMEMVSGWELEEPFSVETVTEFLEIYGGAGLATYRTYISELVGARIKN